MLSIQLKPLLHRGQENIAIDAPNISKLNSAIRKLQEVKWSQTHNVWYTPLNETAYKQIIQTLQQLAAIDNTILKQYLQKRKQVEATQIPGDIRRAKGLFKKPPVNTTAWTLCPANLKALEQLIQKLKLKAYSPSTIVTYRNEFLQLLQLLKNKPVDELTTDDVKRYMVFAMEKLRISEHTAHSRLNALKFYFEQVLGREKFFWEIPRPQRPLQLPKVLSKEEIVRIIKAIENVKHKTMIMLAYGCGLRVSEIVHLTKTDIDENRRLLMIRRGKGKKDRVNSLSPALLVMLREYMNKYQPRCFLFEGQQPGTPYSIRSLEAIIQTAKQKAGIKKGGSMHMLRHSFATHLLDKGTDVVLIQKLLGHNDIKTTLRYLHVTNKDILNILSPLEDIKDLLS